jgi:Circadian oscillating protein COP23
MKFKHFSPILAAASLAIGATSAWGGSQVSQTNKVGNFYCTSNNGNLATVVKNKEGGEQAIFHWSAEAMKDKAFSNSLNGQQLCQNVATKLDNYIANGGRIVGFNTYDEGKLPPAICAKATEKTTNSCDVVLFTLQPGANLADSNRVFDNLLDSRWKQEKIASASNERGVQAITRKVNFMELLFGGGEF